MLAEERRILLVEWTRSDGQLDVGNAAEKLDVTVETVRRDLDLLQRRGLLRRVHGGAIALDRFAHEFTITEREELNPDAKRRISETAAEYIPSEGSIFVDGGTTTLGLARALRDRPKLQVVTSNLSLALRIADSSTKTYVLAGNVRPATLSTVGVRTVEDLSNQNALVAFLGTNGISRDLSFTAYDHDEAAVKRQMMSNSVETIVLADNGKFGATYPATFGRAEDFDRLVTDVDTHSSYADDLSQRGVEVVLA
ncbi:MAG: hypothetical protein RL198_555 [Actinomycetota bacterium]